MMKRVVGVCVGLLLLAACGEKKHDLSADEMSKANIGAKEFASNMGGKFLSCSGLDSDVDQYTTCTVLDSAGKATELSCAYAGGGTGCKIK